MVDTQDLRQESEESLEKKMRKMQDELVRLRMENRTEGLVDTSELKKKKRDLARIKTVLREKEILAQIE